MKRGDAEWNRHLREAAKDLIEGFDAVELVDELVDDGWEEDDAIKLIRAAEKTLKTDGSFQKELELEEVAAGRAPVGATREGCFRSSCSRCRSSRSWS